MIEKRILDNLNTATLLFNVEQKLIYINPMGEILFDISARKILGLHAEKLIHCPGEVVDAAFMRAMETGQPFTERELTLPLPDDRTITVDCSVIPLNEPDKTVYILVELRQIDRQIRISREEQLVSQHHATRALVKGLAHEIKNPLGGIRGAAQLLERALNNDELAEYTQVIIEESDRLKNLMNRMLGPNKLPNHKSVNIHEILERVRALVKAEVSKDITIKRDYDPSIPNTIADFDQLIQATLNIVRNAAQSLGKDGEITLRTRIQRRFTIATQPHRLITKIEIIDNGPGIPSDMIENIFYPMVSGKAEGSGLGLSIAQSIVNQHDGLIECKSQPGKTVFTILLPLEDK